MILYHFTSNENVPPIMAEGLTLGEVPLSAQRVLRGVNLTTSPNPRGHGLDQGGRVVTEEESREYARLGWTIPPGTIFADKLESRLTIRLPSSDRNLRQWLPWARKHVEPSFLPALIEAGGGIRVAKTWWVYWGVISPSAIINVEQLKASVEP